MGTEATLLSLEGRKGRKLTSEDMTGGEEISKTCNELMELTFSAGPR